MKLPIYVLDTLSTLDKAGFKAFVVGGAVRDYLLGRIPYDYDIATNALPEEVTSLFPHTAPTGIKFGTVTVLSENPIEVTTFRKDGFYKDNRHPLAVCYSQKLDDDLTRRDFTINAISYSPKTGFYDPTLGRKDLKLQLIRAVGVPQKRFEEDALRILRAVRFLSKLGEPWKIEKQTFIAMKHCALLVGNLSKERITDEIIKLTLGNNPELGLTALREISQKAFGNILSVPCLNDLPVKAELRLSKLLGANPWLFGWLILSKKTLRHIKKLLLDRSIPKTLPELRHLSFLIGRDWLDDWLILRGQQPQAQLIKDDAITISDLVINGDDIAKLGVSGPRIGKILHKLAFLVREDPEINKRATLFTLVNKEKEP